MIDKVCLMRKHYDINDSTRGRKELQSSYWSVSWEPWSAFTLKICRSSQFFISEMLLGTLRMWERYETKECVGDGVMQRVKVISSKNETSVKRTGASNSQTLETIHRSIPITRIEKGNKVTENSTLFYVHHYIQMYPDRKSRQQDVAHKRI